LKRTSHITLFVATDEEVIAAPKKDKKKDATEKTKSVDKADSAKKTENAKDEKVVKNEGPAKADPSKAAGKAHRKPTEPVKKATKAAPKGKPVAERKENMRKKGA
jgi:hypothetical protein